MAITAQREHYIDIAVTNVMTPQVLDKFADTKYSEVQSRVHGSVAVYTVDTIPDGDTTAVDPNTGAANSVSPIQTTVEIAMSLYHDYAMPVTGAGPLYGTVGSEPNKYYDRAIKSVGGMAAKDMNTLAKAALLTDIPNTGAWTWGTSGTTKAYASTCTGSETNGGHILVLNGNVPGTPKAAPVNVTAGENLNDPKFLDTFHGWLHDNGAEFITNLGGEGLYHAIISERQWGYLKDSGVTEADFQNYPDWGSDIHPLLAHGVKVYRGFIISIVPTPHMQQAATVVGAAGQAIDTCIFHGAGYMAKAFLPTAALPRGIVSPVETIPATDVTELRITPQGDAGAMNSNVTAVSYGGFGILLPEAGLKVNFSAT